MKLFYLLQLLFFATASCLLCDIQYPITTRQLELKGNIQTVLEKETTVKGSKDSLVRKQIVSEILYKIISPNNVIIQYHNQQGILSNYTYTSNNTLLAINRTILSNKKMAGRTAFIYDNNGKAICELIYTRDDILKDSIAINYDNVNKATIRNYYDANKIKYKTEEQWYNSKGNEIKNVQKIGADETRIIYQYDDTEEKLIEERWYLNGKNVQKVYYNYANNLLISKVEQNERGETTAATNYEYDMISGLVLSAKSGNNITSYEYNFDANDNWIVKYEYYDDYPVKIIEREIKY